MLKRGTAFVGLTIGAGLYAYAMSLLPRPHAINAFWAGNLCAPWLVLAFLAGRFQRSWAVAVCAGVAADVACFLGSYAGEVAQTGSLRSYAVNKQWFYAALVAGSLYGALGWWWRRSRAVVPGLALAAGIIAEPAIWPAYDRLIEGGPVKHDWALWAGEILVGLAAAAWFSRTGRRSTGPSAGSPSPAP
jgi:hypothetical protein